MKKLIILIAVSVAIIILAGSCEIDSPYIDAISDKITSDTYVVISGNVYDAITGAPIPGAKVGFGNYLLSTDSSGNYSFTVPKGTNITGTFYACNGNAHNFRVFTAMDITPDSDSVYNIPMYPADTSALPAHTLSGNVDSFNFDEITQINFIIHNENGGVYSTSYTTDGTTESYNISTPTFGQDCVIEIYIENQFYYYVTGIDLTPADKTLNFEKPASGFSDVTVSGTVNNTYGAYMKYTPEIVLYAVPDKSLTASPETIQIYNPENKPVSWYSCLSENDTPATGYSTSRTVYTSYTIPGSSVSLPGTAIQAPDTVVDSASIDYSNGILSFTGSSDYFSLYFFPDEYNMGGNITTDRTTINLPADINAILTSTSDSSTLWDVSISSSYVTPKYSLDMLLSNTPPGGTSFAEVYGTSKSDLIN